MGQKLSTENRLVIDDNAQAYNPSHVDSDKSNGNKRGSTFSLQSLQVTRRLFGSVQNDNLTTNDKKPKSLVEYFKDSLGFKDMSKTSNRSKTSSKSQHSSRRVSSSRSRLDSPHNSIIRSTLEKRIHFLNDNSYNFKSEIDAGAFAQVYHCTRECSDLVKGDKKSKQRSYAIKRIDLGRRCGQNLKFLRKFLEREILIHCSLNHPNIVRYNETLLQGNTDIYMSLEFVKKGNLLEYCRLSGPLDLVSTRIIGFQLLKAIEYIHSQNIVHRDLKCENVLVQSLAPVQIKIADFGFARYVGESSNKNTRGLSYSEIAKESNKKSKIGRETKFRKSMIGKSISSIVQIVSNIEIHKVESVSKTSSSRRSSTRIPSCDIRRCQSGLPTITENSKKESFMCKTFCGSLAYAPPELVKGGEYDGRKVDIWSFGCILFILLTQRMAFRDRGNNVLLVHEQRNGIIWPKYIVDEIPEAIQALVEWILTFDYRARPLVDSIMKHSLFTDDVDDLSEYSQIKISNETSYSTKNSSIKG